MLYITNLIVITNFQYMYTMLKTNRKKKTYYNVTLTFFHYPFKYKYIQLHLYLI